MLTVRDRDHTPTKVLQSLGQHTHSLGIEVIGGLVQGDDVGLSPESRPQHEPRLLSGREATDHTLCAHFLRHLERLEVLLDLTLGEGPVRYTRRLRCEALIIGTSEAVHSHHPELGHRLEGILLGVIQSFPFDLIDDVLAAFLPSHYLLRRISVLAMLLGHLSSDLLLLLGARVLEAPLELLVVAVPEAQLEVMHRRALQELLQVECVVLRDV
mmetsp:Transcript_48339/g.100021  ORF Transcript_48339/g.100021 Transcript_48339/m.100021 type:complete len:213 (+) Transcript_48339:260-898(+)